MKIVPINFKNNSKFVRSKLSKKLGVNIPPTQINDYMARGYGWNHYSEMNIASTKHDVKKYKLESELTYIEQEKLLNNIITELLQMISDATYDGQLNRARYNQKVIDTYAMYLFLLLGKKLVEENDKRLKSNFFNLSEGQLRTHSMFSIPDEKQRMNAILKLVKKGNKSELKLKNSIWFLTKEEYLELKPFIKQLQKNNVPHSISYLTDNIKDYLKEEQHKFFVLPDKIEDSLEIGTKVLNEVLMNLREWLNKNLEGSSLNPDIISKKPSLDTILYINSDWYDLPNFYGIFIAQARSLGIASFIGNTSMTIYECRQDKEVSMTTIANSNNRILPLDDVRQLSFLIQKECYDAILDYKSENSDCHYIAVLFNSIALLDEKLNYKIGIEKLAFLSKFKGEV